MREKILSLLSSLGKGENACANSVFFGEDGQIRPWLFLAFENFISTIAQLPLERKSLPTVSAFERRGSLSASTFENATKEGASSCLQNFSSNISQTPSERKDSLVGSSHAFVVKDGSLSCPEIVKESRQIESIQASITQHGNEGKQIISGTCFHKEEEARKEKFLKLIQQAINKGNIVLKGDDFLEQCSNILKIDLCHEDKSNRITSTGGNEVMVAGETVDVFVEAGAAGKIGFLAVNDQEREKKEGKGPEVNSPPDNSACAVNDASMLPMLQGDRFPEKGGTKGTDQGQKAIPPAGLRLPYADVVKGGTQLPIHVNNQPISNFVSLHNVTCMEISAEEAPAVQSVPCHSPRHGTLASSEIADLERGKLNKASDSPLTSSNATMATAQQTVSAKNKVITGFPASSKEGTPLLIIDNEVLKNRMSLCKFSIIGKLSLAKGEEP